MNEIPLAIANRDNFTYPGLRGVQSGIGVWDQSADEESARECLRLRPDDNEYYLLALLKTVLAHPAIEMLFGETARSYCLHAEVASTAAVYNADLVADLSGPPKILRKADEFPTFFNIDVTYHSANVAKVVGGTHDELVRIKQTSDSKLYVPWPVWTGVSGLLVPHTSFGEGFEVSIHHTPVSYPHENVEQAIRSNSAFRRLLRDAGLTSQFHYADTAAEAVAVAALALGKHNTRVYGE